MIFQTTFEEQSSYLHDDISSSDHWYMLQSLSFVLFRYENERNMRAIAILAEKDKITNRSTVFKTETRLSF